MTTLDYIVIGLLALAAIAFLVGVAAFIDYIESR